MPVSIEPTSVRGKKRRAAPARLPGGPRSRARDVETIRAQWVFVLSLRVALAIPLVVLAFSPILSARFGSLVPLLVDLVAIGVGLALVRVPEAGTV